MAVIQNLHCPAIKVEVPVSPLQNTIKHLIYFDHTHKNKPKPNSK